MLVQAGTSTAFIDEESFLLKINTEEYYHPKEGELFW